MCQNARKMHHFEAKNPKKFWQPPHQTPPHWEGDTPSQTPPLCSNIVDDKTVTVLKWCEYWNWNLTEIISKKNFIETRTEKNPDTV